MNKFSRRSFLKLSCALGLAGTSKALGWSKQHSIYVNDVHSQLNLTRVSKIVTIRSVEQLQQLVASARARRTSLAICGAKHAGGGQQFLSDSLLLDTTNFDEVLKFDSEQGFLEVQSGIRWTQVMEFLEKERARKPHFWGIVQKQTGADYLSLGDTVGANAHGQGLKFKPIVQDIESLTLINANGKLLKCSRQVDPTLFSMVIGGYGLFGVVSSVTLRLMPRKLLRRDVKVISLSELANTYNRSVSNGCIYGDFQCNVDDRSNDFLSNGIFASYIPVHPVTDETSISQHKLTKAADWLHFLYEAHVNKKQAFKEYTEFHLQSSGTIDWSDQWHNSPYVINYHSSLDKRLHIPHKSSEVLTEIYVPPEHLTAFIEKVRLDLLQNNVNLIYSTIRFIEKDKETFLAWAKQSYACVIFNLHVIHEPTDIAQVAETLRRLIDYAIKYGGSYYLTYHKFARKDQILACYPQFTDFLRQKREKDPADVFCSNWYRYYKRMFRQELS